MTPEELKTTILVGSYLQNVGIGGKRLESDLFKKLPSSEHAINAAEELAEWGLIDIKAPDLGSPKVSYPWEITEKGEDLLRNLDNKPSALKEFGILDKFHVGIVFGSGSVSFHNEEHHTATNINITNIRDSIVNQIDLSKASEQEKQEAKSRLARFFDYPLVKTVFETAISAAIKAAVP